MSDLISRAELFDELNRRGVPYNTEVNMVINGMPSAQPYTEEEIQAMQELESAEIEKAYELGRESAQQERKKGKWVYGEDDYGIDGYHCDKCGFFVPWDYTHKFINYIDDYNFCPNCGTCMKGEQP